MSEKAYKTMAYTGVGTLVVGIIVLATGIVSGIILIVNGVKLMKDKYEITI